MSTVEMVSPDRAKRALQMLRCFLCKQYMLPPISSCINNHRLCVECVRKNQTQCPGCKQNYLGTRTSALEELATSLRYPCRYDAEGCAGTFPLEEINIHERYCVYRPYECPLSKYTKCTWKGQLSWIHYHVSASHQGCCVTFHDPTARTVEWQISKNGCFTDYTHVVFAFGEVFLYHKKFDYDKKRLCIAIQYLGPVANSTKFKYKLKFIRKDSTQVLSMSHVAHHEDEKIDMVFSTGDCVVVYYETLSLLSRSIMLFKIYKLGDVKVFRGYVDTSAKKHSLPNLHITK
ncbi:E3 ubiquitin-protein ligase sina [Anabrus simplex]|uniref:E3 ubiquitin-protein ligase sina n=1 Tax=Anabrus simplex TaxID=316456 RepID=UPI0035A2A680